MAKNQTQIENPRSHSVHDMPWLKLIMMNRQRRMIDLKFGLLAPVLIGVVQEPNSRGVGTPCS
jgi:hypothetical protein